MLGTGRKHSSGGKGVGRGAPPLQKMPLRGCFAGEAAVKCGRPRPRRSSCDAGAQSYLGAKRRRAGGAAEATSSRSSRSRLVPGMGLLELCEQVFGTADLYQVLGVRREASDGEVRRGYHKVSLQVHPDRVEEDQKEDATRRFQVCGPALRRLPGPVLSEVPCS